MKWKSSLTTCGNKPSVVNKSKLHSDFLRTTLGKIKERKPDGNTRIGGQAQIWHLVQSSASKVLRSTNTKAECLSISINQHESPWFEKAPVQLLHLVKRKTSTPYQLTAMFVSSAESSPLALIKFTRRMVQVRSTSHVVALLTKVEPLVSSHGSHSNMKSEVC